MTRAAIERLLMPSTYLNYLAKVFDDHVRLCAGTPLLPAEIGSYDRPVPVAHVLTCVKNALAMAGQPGWHLPYAKSMSAHFHGPVTLAILNAPTLGDGLAALVRYMPKRVPYHHWQGVQADGQFRCELLELIDFGPVRASVVEIPILVMHEYVHIVRGGNMAGAHVELRYPPTAYADAYARYFACPVRFDAPRNALVVPAEWLAERNHGHDEAAWRMALRRCEQTSSIPREQDTLSRVRHEIQSTLEAAGGACGPPRLHEVALRLHVSPRTLIRRLREAGTTYQAIVDDIQMARARDLLDNAAYRVCDVAVELGFHDPASFGRSFKRWFGMTPGAYRGGSNGRGPLSG